MHVAFGVWRIVFDVWCFRCVVVGLFVVGCRLLVYGVVSIVFAFVVLLVFWFCFMLFEAVGASWCLVLVCVFGYWLKFVVIGSWLCGFWLGLFFRFGFLVLAFAGLVYVCCGWCVGCWSLAGWLLVVCCSWWWC